MKKILYVILEQWADWELAYLSSAVNMLGHGKFENKTVSLTKTDVTSIGGIKCLPDYDLQSVPSERICARNIARFVGCKRAKNQGLV